jgi:hypothetical protein
MQSDYGCTNNKKDFLSHTKNLVGNVTIFLVMTLKGTFRFFQGDVNASMENVRYGTSVRVPSHAFMECTVQTVDHQ